MGIAQRNKIAACGDCHSFFVALMASAVGAARFWVKAVGRGAKPLGGWEAACRPGGIEKGGFPPSAAIPTRCFGALAVFLASGYRY